MTTSLMGSSGMKIPKGYKPFQLPTMSPESYDLWRDLMGRARGGTMSGLDLLGKLGRGEEEAFEGLEKPYYSALQRMGGDIASRFSGAGMGARGSSGFRNAMAGAAQNLSEQLGSQRLGLQRDAISQLLELSEMLLGRQPYETGLIRKEKGKNLLDKIIGVGAPIAGTAIGGYFGGPVGAYLGGTIGSGIGSSFLD